MGGCKFGFQSLNAVGKTTQKDTRKTELSQQEKRVIECKKYNFDDDLCFDCNNFSWCKKHPEQRQQLSELTQEARV